MHSFSSIWLYHDYPTYDDNVCSTLLLPQEQKSISSCCP